MSLPSGVERAVGLRRVAGAEAARPTAPRARCRPWSARRKRSWVPTRPISLAPTSHQCVSSADGRVLDNFERSFREWGRMLSQPVLYFVDPARRQHRQCRRGARNEAVSLPGRATTMSNWVGRSWWSMPRAGRWQLIYTGGKGFSPSVNLEARRQARLGRDTGGALRARARRTSSSMSSRRRRDVQWSGGRGAAQRAGGRGAALARDGGGGVF